MVTQTAYTQNNSFYKPIAASVVIAAAAAGVFIYYKSSKDDGKQNDTDDDAQKISASTQARAAGDDARRQVLHELNLTTAGSQSQDLNLNNKEIADSLIRCVHMPQTETTHGFAIEVRNCCDTLAKATKQDVVYAAFVPRNFEDNTHDAHEFDEPLQNLINYYISTYKVKANTELTDEEQVRMDMFLLAKHSVNEFGLCTRSFGNQVEHVVVIAANVARNVVVKYFMRQLHILEFYKKQSAISSVNDMKDFFMQLLEASKYDPSAMFAVDFAMFNIVRRAMVDTASDKTKFELTAQEYLSSALAKLSYPPTSRDVRFRTYQQRATCIQQLNVYSCIFEEIMYNMVNVAQDNNQFKQVMNALNTTLGHATMLTYLSHSGYIIKSIVTQIDAKLSEELYIQALYDSIGSAQPEMVDAQLNITIQEFLNAISSGNPIEVLRMYNNLYLQVIGYAIKDNRDNLDDLRQLYRRVQSLDAKTYETISQFAKDIRQDIPQTQTAGLSILRDTWNLEHKLYNAYILRHDLVLGRKMYDEEITQLLDHALYMQTQDAAKDACEDNAFSEKDIQALQTTLTSRYLNKQNDPNLRSCTGLIVELCDADCRLCDLYDIHVDRAESQYVSSNMLQIARMCVSELQNKFMKQ